MPFSFKKILILALTITPNRTRLKNIKIGQGKMTEVAELLSPERKQAAVQRAKYRSRAARWDIDVAVFLFLILITIIILLFQGAETTIMAPAAALGLALGWLMGWKKGQQLYQTFLREELEKELKDAIGWDKEEAIEEQIQQALRERYH
jgi:glycerol uptake facilitator-like aquaporin